MNGEVFCFDAVAPVRERGLKSKKDLATRLNTRRSRKGAWIEIRAIRHQKVRDPSLP